MMKEIVLAPPEHCKSCLHSALEDNGSYLPELILSLVGSGLVADESALRHFMDSTLYGLQFPRELDVALPEAIRVLEEAELISRDGTRSIFKVSLRLCLRCLHFLAKQACLVLVDTFDFCPL